MNILVTGGAGFIGSHTLIELHNAGHRTMVIDNLSNSNKTSLKRVGELIHTEIPFYQVDIRDREGLEKVMANHHFDACIHFAGLKAVGESVEKPWEYYDNNIAGTLVLLDVLRKHNCKNIIFSSSATVYGNPQIIPITEECPKGQCTNPYGKTKSMLEDVMIDMQKADPEWNIVLLRYFNPIGAHPSGRIGENPNGIPNNLMPYVTQVAVGKRKELGVFGNDYDTPDGTGVRDYIHVVDLAKGHVAALKAIERKCGLGIYNLGTGHGYSVLQLVETFKKVNNIDIPFSIKPRRAGDIATCYSNPAKAEKELGWKAQYGLEEMCRDAWNWQHNNPEGYQKRIKTTTMTKRTIIITGGAGFIGSHVVRLFVNKYPEYRIINLDKLTYAGNLANLKDIEDKPNYRFVKMDICDFEGVYQLMQDEHVDGIIHLAAESHVDRSIKDPFTFAQTNVMGTLSMLQAAKLYWESLPEKWEGKRFYHISTDEVYGALEMTHPQGIESPFTTKASSGEHHLAYGEKFFTEDLKYQPHSPYSAAKASSDHFVRAFHDTYGMPTVVTNCSNNYGPYQFPEKLIPLFINNIRHRKPLPVYGKGENVRDWLFVEDHARAIDLIFHEGKVAETYNIGGFNEWKNIDIIHVLIKTVDHLLGRPEGADEDLITYVTDRAGHDMRYAIDSTKLQKELGWEPSLQFEEGIEKTVRWYLDNQDWMNNVTSGDYLKYYEDMYANR